MLLKNTCKITRCCGCPSQLRREGAGAIVSHQQMRPGTLPYPVDRYLVQSNIQNEQVNIISDDIWNPEPALRPEDEIMLRKLHEMLQSTAHDLKLLSSEITRHHEQGTQVKVAPTPLDDEFNDKVHIEEIVDAKFNGHKIIEKKTLKHYSKTDVIDGLMQKNRSKQQAKKLVTTGVQVYPNIAKVSPKYNKIQKLSVSRIKTMEICSENEKPQVKKSLLASKKPNPPVSYSQFSYEYVEPKINIQTDKHLQLQEMPSISIRSELKTQKVLQMDIFPQMKNDEENTSSDNNVAVISIQYEVIEDADKGAADGKISNINPLPYTQPLTRKTLKMSPGESSESTYHNISYLNRRPCIQKQRKRTYNPSPPHQNQIPKNKLDIKMTREIKRSQKYLEEWKRRLNSVYKPSVSQIAKTGKTRKNIRNPVNLETRRVRNDEKASLNNAVYIPYSKLTLGGVMVSDIEDEISNISNKNSLVLSPILDKILGSRENSFNRDSPRTKNDRSPKILTTSDENLLQEVLDVQSKVTNLLPEKCKDTQAASDIVTVLNDSYADDFDDDRTDISDQSYQNSSKCPELESDNESQNKTKHNHQGSQHYVEDKRNNQTFTKLSNLSFKNSVDIFEFVHSVDTQENATQSSHTSKISLKETQTSPRNDKPIQPIHNNLWPSIDPRGDVEHMFKFEKDFIKKLIIDEYGDIIEKALNKPSTSKSLVEHPDTNNICSQKNTQTSPAHVKTVMTSPTRTKSRTTSPFVMSTVNQQLSPIVITKTEYEQSAEKNDNDLAMSINLSSPRFNLRLPQTSCEVLSNIDKQSNVIKKKRDSQNIEPKIKQTTLQKQMIPKVSSSSSSVEDYSSDVSSIGQINQQFKKMQRQRMIPSFTDLSSSSTISKSSFEMSTNRLPVRSDGEMSLGQINKRKPRSGGRIRKSDGEMSLGQLL